MRWHNQNFMPIPHLPAFCRIPFSITLRMKWILLGITLAFAKASEAQTCTAGVESANPLGTCGGCEDQVQRLHHRNISKSFESAEIFSFS